jgi:hypothetical protein
MAQLVLMLVHRKTVAGLVPLAGARASVGKRRGTLWPILYQERAERLGRPPLVPLARAAAALAGDVARPAC